jgi:hypothetical protein
VHTQRLRLEDEAIDYGYERKEATGRTAGQLRKMIADAQAATKAAKDADRKRRACYTSIGSVKTLSLRCAPSFLPTSSFSASLFWPLDFCPLPVCIHWVWHFICVNVQCSSHSRLLDDATLFSRMQTSLLLKQGKQAGKTTGQRRRLSTARTRMQCTNRIIQRMKKAKMTTNRCEVARLRQRPSSHFLQSTPRRRFGHDTFSNLLRPKKFS